MNEKFSFEIPKLKEYDSNFPIDKDFTIHNAAILSNPQNECIMFVKKWSDEINEKLSDISNSLIIAPLNAHVSSKIIEKNQMIYVNSPRLEYAKILHFILELNKKKQNFRKFDENDVFGSNSFIGTTSVVGAKTRVEPFVFIENDVEIGENCLIKHGAYIGPYVKIGDNCVIKENAVVGGQGFGVERDNDGRTFKIPHIGGVIIGENVEIGGVTTIVTGTIEPTIIEDYAKIDDHVHIAHNCKIGRGSIITACAEVSGSLKMGKNSWVGPNASLMNGIEIAEGSTIGLGAVVTRSFTEPNKIIFGNPAMTKEEHKKRKEGK